MSVFMNGVNSIARDRDLQSAFYGYNHNPVIRNGEFYDERNLSGEQFPALCARAPMGAITVNEEHPYTADKEVDSMYRGFIRVGTKLYSYAEEVMTGLPESHELIPPKRQYASMGAYLVLWPDRLILNTQTGDVMPMDDELTISAGSIMVSICMADGSDLGVTESSTAPPTPSDGDYWLDTSGEIDVLKQWIARESVWISIPTTYVRIRVGTRMDTHFSAGDGVKIEGLIGNAAHLNGYHVLTTVSDYYVVIPGIVRGGSSLSPLTFARKAPQMDYICEQNNRLYGCSSATNEIYASKFGDPTNWNVFEDGAAYASYVEQAGTPGKFTGCCAFRGNVLFFKEDCIHILYGSLPENFRLETLHAPGVKHGAFRSIAQGNEVLYYLSPDGVMAYSGASSFPEKISDALGENHNLYYGTGIVANGCYYLSCQYESDEYYYVEVGGPRTGCTFRYEIERGIWHREDDRYYESMATDGSLIYLLCKEDNTIYTKFVREIYTGAIDTHMGQLHAETLYDLFLFDDEMISPQEKPFKELPGEEHVSWMLQTGPMGLDSPDAKFISQVTLRLMAEAGTDIRLLVEYDDTGRFTEVMRVHRSRIGSFTLPFVPRRCDTMRIRIEGEGGFRLYSIAKTVEGR